ncbi:hypothetical protein G7054_g9237 [Neopestalotiopsis clavispora]|nr:hypothetical protein G7054_g9237 [Neopestalotiopsis clavispora]
MTIAKDNSLRQSKSIGKVSWEGALLNKSQQPRLSTFSEVSQPKLHGEEQAESAPNTYALQLQKHQEHTANHARWHGSHDTQIPQMASSAISTSRGAHQLLQSPYSARHAFQQHQKVHILQDGQPPPGNASCNQTQGKVFCYHSQVHQVSTVSLLRRRDREERALGTMPEVSEGSSGAVYLQCTQL